jgi:hypothetical protein
MLATLSPEFQVAAILDEIGCVPTNFSEIADRHANSRVIAALQGRNDFEPEDGEYYLGVARQLKKLADEFPVPIDWRKTQTIKETIAARRTVIRPIPFAVIYVGSLLFKRIASGRIETTASYRDCAAFKDLSVATVAARLLDSMGEHGLRVTTITNERRAAETIFDQLADFGFTQ